MSDPKNVPLQGYCTKWGVEFSLWANRVKHAPCSKVPRFFLEYILEDLIVHLANHPSDPCRTPFWAKLWATTCGRPFRGSTSHGPRASHGPGAFGFPGPRPRISYRNAPSAMDPRRGALKRAGRGRASKATWGGWDGGGGGGRGGCGGGDIMEPSFCHR